MTHIPGHFQALRPPVNRLAGQAQPGISLALPPGQVPAGPIQPGQVQTQPFGQPVPLNQPQVPPTGLIGSEAALQAGLQGGLGALAQGGQGALNLLGGAAGEARGFLGGARQDILGGFGQGQQAIGQAIGQGVQGFQGFQQPGQGAFNLLAAQTGALGAPAQQQAFQNFQESPNVQFLREQGLRQLGSGAAAQGGGTRGGDFSRDLSRFNQGLALQDLSRQQGLLQGLGGQGLQAAGQVGQLRGQEAGLRGSLFGQQAGQLGNLGQFGAGQAFNFGQAGSGLLQNLGINQANLLTGAGRDVSAGRLQTGQGIAAAVGAGAGDVFGLQERGGAGLSDILGGAGITAANLQTQFGNLSAADQQALAAILANISTGQGSQLANIQNQPFAPTNILGQIGQVASGLGGVLAAFPNQQQPPGRTPPIATINTGSQFAGFA